MVETAKPFAQTRPSGSTYLQEFTMRCFTIKAPSAPAVMILPSNPQRFSLVFNCTVNGKAVLGFTQQITVFDNILSIQEGQTKTFTFKDFGPFVTNQWWLLDASFNPEIGVCEVIYAPDPCP